MRILTCLPLLLSLVACNGHNVAGKYSLDKTAMRAEMQKMMEAQMPKGSDKATPDMMKQVLDRALDSMQGNLQLAADGTFDAEYEKPMEGKVHEKGTYKVEGDKITMTGKQEGKDAEKTMTGQISGSTISLAVDTQGQKMNIVLKKD